MTGAIEPRDVAASSANDCRNDCRNDSLARGTGRPALEADRRSAERVATLDCGCDPTASAEASPCVWAAGQQPPAVGELHWKASPLAWSPPPLDLETTLIDGVDAARGVRRTGCVRRESGSDTVAARSPREVPGCALSACALPAKAVPSRGRRTAAKRATATCPRSDQRAGSVAQPQGCSRRALRVGVPQGPKDFGERSDAKVYGATPSSAAKETATLPKAHWGGGRSRGRRSPSGESPKASRGATTKSVHPSINVEGGEA